MNPAFNTREYLNRIGIEETGIGYEFLRKIHVAHLYTVPFENLSIHCGEKIILDRDRLFDKIVIRRRGGFCYELNYLFYNLIISLGYKARMVSAQVYNERGIAGPEFDHMAVIAAAEGEEFLCDTGFGDSFIEPMPFILNKEHSERGRIYKITDTGENHLRLLRNDDTKQWAAQYDFTNISRNIDEYKPMCLFHQTSPDSTFTQKKVCTIAVPGGRITLRENRLIITEGNTKKEINFTGDAIFSSYLKKYFGVEL